MKMASEYDFSAIEKKWQKYWEENQTFKAVDFSPKPKYYCLDMFPYPSGAGLHVGHPEGYTATDILCRYRRMKGFNVLHPMGWDAFGLPAEQYAIETGTHPEITTEKNVDNFRRQIKALGFSYDWSREINTTRPAYFKWTQWIFSQLHKKGLAYLDEIPVNWCPALGTVLANEEVINGLSERGSHPVIRRPMKQWMLRITEYAERLLNDLDELDWPEGVKEMQRNWIGKSTGAEVKFMTTAGEAVTVYTTRPDTLFGATYMVLAPEHPLVDALTTPDRKAEVDAYREAAAKKSELARTGENSEKTGAFTGAYATNPVDGRQIPIWIADYVLVSYGTGAIMAVPAHDTRDFEFARTFNLPVVCIIEPDPEAAKAENVDVEAVHRGEACWTGEGKLIHSSNGDGLKLDGLSVAESKPAATRWLEERGLGREAVKYKLRDWLFSRQRYWGEPFPIIHYEDGSIELVNSDELPVDLPEMEDFKPAGAAAFESEGLAELHRPENRPPGKTRNEHHAAVGRFVLVLPALYRPRQRRTGVGPGEGEILDAGRPLRRRRRTRGAASALRPFLAQGAVRSRAGFDQRAVPEADQPGHDPRRQLQGQTRRAGSDRPGRIHAGGTGPEERRRSAGRVPGQNVEVAAQRHQSR